MKAGSLLAVAAASLVCGVLGGFMGGWLASGLRQEIKVEQGTARCFAVVDERGDVRGGVGFCGFGDEPKLEFEAEGGGRSVS